MKKCFRCERTLPNFMYVKTDTPHLLKMGLTHGMSCRLCLFKKAWSYGMKELDRSLRLEKAIKKHKKSVVALGEPAHYDYDTELWENIDD